MEDPSHPHLVDLVSCAVCYERFNECDHVPKSLPCLHNFCLGCLQMLNTVKMDEIIACPTCRQEFPVPSEGIESLPTSFVVLNLLNHVPEKTDNWRPTKPTLCALHPNNKCDFCCDNCRVPLCHDCIVNLNKSEHKHHNIRQLKAVAEELNTGIMDITKIVDAMCTESEERFEELEKNLVSSRDGLKNQTKIRLDTVVQDANKWYSDTNNTIDKEFKVLMGQIREAKQKVKTQRIKVNLREVTIMQNKGLVEEVSNSLSALNSAIEQFKRSSFWPPSKWSVSVGSLTNEVTMVMGELTPRELTLPRMERFFFPENPVITFLCSSSLTRPSFMAVGLTVTEVVVAYTDETKLQKLDTKTNIACVTEENLPEGITYDCIKYILSDGCILLWNWDSGPTYILNSDLNVTNTIDKNYGYMIGAYSKLWVAFLTDGLVQIVDLEKKQMKKILRPPDGITWSRWLSVCKNPDNEETAVVDRDNKILMIHNGTNSLLHTCHLQFLPCACYAVSCSRDHIYVASDDPASVHIYSWQGVLLTSMDREQLRIQKGHYVWNIHAAGDKFVVATGPLGYAASVKMFQCL